MGAGGNQPDLDLFLGWKREELCELGLGQRGVQRHRDIYGFSHVWLGWVAPGDAAERLVSFS